MLSFIEILNEKVSSKEKLSLDGKVGKDKKAVAIFDEYQDAHMRAGNSRRYAKRWLEKMVNDGIVSKRSDMRQIGSADKQWIWDMMDDMLKAGVIEVAPGRAKSFVGKGQSPEPIKKPKPKKKVKSKDIPYEREDGIHDKGEKYAIANRLERNWS